MITVDNFLGFSSKADKVLGPAIASDCHNVIINKGDLCNHPYEKEFEAQGVGQEKLLLWAKEAPIIFYASGLIKYFIPDIFVRPRTPITIFLGDLWPIGLNSRNGLRTDPMASKITVGNIFRYGEFILLLGDYTPIDFNPDTDFIRMPRIWPKYKDDNEFDKYNLGLVGIRAPASFTISKPAGIGWAGTRQYALTFVTQFEDSEVEDPDEQLGLYDIESNMCIGPDEDTYGSNQQATFTVTLPERILQTEPSPVVSRVKVGVYARDSSESLFRFVCYHGIGSDNPHVFTLSGSFTPHATKTPPIAEHGVPYASYHMCEFKGRIYSNVIPPRKKFKNEYPINLLQVSPLFNEEYLRSGYAISDPASAQIAGHKIVNYVDTALGQPVGKNTSISGLIVFLGQLIIFQKKKTWVLTDDIQVGTIRELFSDRGCVNEEGGKGFVVYNDKLYFVDSNGVYMYDGTGPPILVSALIDEELEAIEYKRYSYCRLSVNSREGLIYLTFPVGPEGCTEEIPTYILHPEEGMVWTKLQGMQLSEVIEVDEKIIFNKIGGLSKLAQLDEEVTLTTPLMELIWFYHIGLTTAKDEQRRKYWGDLTLESIFNEFSINVGTENADDIVPEIIENHIHLGLWSKYLYLRLFHSKSSSSEILKPFRLNGYKLTHRIAGVR